MPIDFEHILTSIVIIIFQFVFIQVVIPLFKPNLSDKMYLQRKKILRLFNQTIKTELVIKCNKIYDPNSNSLSNNIKQLLISNYDHVITHDLFFQFKLPINDRQIPTEITLIPDGTLDDIDYVNIAQIQCRFSMNIKHRNLKTLLDYTSAINDINKKFKELKINFEGKLAIICKLDNPPEIYRNTNLCSFDHINGNIKNDTRTITIKKNEIIIYSENLDDVLANYVDKAITQYVL